VPQTRLILHDARCATTQVDGDGRRQPLGPDWEFWPGVPGAIPALNGLLGEMTAEVCEALPEAAVVRAPAELTLAADAHRWGLAPFHYVDAYYEAIGRELEALGCVPRG
jgi:hypothetical protein